jgi:hypothetical protein
VITPWSARRRSIVVPAMTAALVECCRKVVLLKCDRLYLGVNGGVSIVPEGRWRSAGTGRGSANDAAVVGAHIRPSFGGGLAV